MKPGRIIQLTTAESKSAANTQISSSESESEESLSSGGNLVSTKQLFNFPF